MDAAYLAQHIGIPVEEVEELLDLKAKQIYQSAFYQSLVQSLDYNTLSGTLPHIRAAYDRHLPSIIDHIRNELGYTGNPMTASTLSNWVLGFLHEPSYLSKIAEFHQRVPMDVMEVSLVGILDILGGVEKGGRDWQRALVVLSLPLYATA